MPNTQRQPLGALELQALITCEDIEEQARQHITHQAYEYVAGGAGAGLTLAANRAAYDRVQLLPRVLRDVSRIDTTCTLFGRAHDFPLLLAPTGYHMLMHPEGELATVAGANESGAVLCAASFSNVTIEQMAEASASPLWFQLYVQDNREFTQSLIERAVQAGCEAICVTVDMPTNGPRDRELRAGFKLPPGVQRANLAGLGAYIAAGAHRPNGRNIYTATHAPNVTWNDITWLRSLVPGKLLLKGILHPEDAEAAKRAGCDGIIVSNHGGRSLDSVPATLDVLPAIVARVGREFPVLVDGGIRRGIDIFKSLALGAHAVMVGRPYMYGLAIGGADGVARVVEILRTELEMTMGLAGCQDLSSIGASYLRGSGEEGT